MKLPGIFTPPEGSWRIRPFIWSLLLPLIATTATNGAFSGFTLPFDPTVVKIQFTTANTTGFFRVGDPVGLATSDGYALNVFRLDGQLIYSGAATTLNLAAGHYFV